MTFEEKMKRLNEIIELINNSELSLEETINFYEEGKKLIIELKSEIKNAEQRITKIIE